MKTPLIQTGRLLLREPFVTDAESIFKNWTRDRTVSKFVRWSTHRSIDDTIKWLIAEEENSDSDSIYNWIFVNLETDEIIGSGGLIYNERRGMFELGYVIMRKFWNNGFTTEAAKAMVNFAVSELGQTRLYAEHAKQNPASGRVLEKVGFVYQKDGSYTSFSGRRTFESREYIFTADSGA